MHKFPIEEHNHVHDHDKSPDVPDLQPLSSSSLFNRRQDYDPNFTITAKMQMHELLEKYLLYTNNRR